MEEIIDIDELAEKEKNEKLKEYLKEDETVSKELSDKIEELQNEKSKLSKKNIEIKEKEESLRDKLTHDSSTDEIRKIADEIDEIKEEMTTISNNIEKLEKELEEIINAKTKTEETKKQYKEKVSSTIDEYEKKISTIEAAIKVCDNEYLKKAQEEELQRMKDTLEGLKEDRSKELKEALGTAIKEEVKVDDTVIPEVKVSSINDEVNILKEEKSNDSINEEEKESYSNQEDIDINMDILNSLNLDTVEEQKVEPVSDIQADLNVDLTLPTDVEINDNQSTEIDSQTEPLFNLNEDLINLNIDEPVLDNAEVADNVNIDDIKPSIDLNDLTSFSNVTEINVKNGTKIEKTDIVPEEKINQIFSSRGIMPNVYNYLDDQSKVGV